MNHKKTFKMKRIVSGMLALTLLSGGAALPSDVMSNVASVITVQAAGNVEDCYSFDEASGVLTLRGNVDSDAVKNFNNKYNVNMIIAEEGTVLPEICDLIFSDFTRCTFIDLSKADTSKVTSMYGMFYFCSSLTQLDLSNFDTSNVTGMSLMFGNMYDLTTLDISGFDTSNVTSMSNMFNNCYSLTSLDLSGFDTSNVTTFYQMFTGCSSLKSLDLSGFDTSNVVDMSRMFGGCYNLLSLDLSSFNTSNLVRKSHNLITGMGSMFWNCKNLNTITLGENFETLADQALLLNGNGWVNVKAPKTVISGDGRLAVIENNGTNTYKLNGSFKITYPTDIKWNYSEKYHQLQFTWDKVDGADRYSIAVYQSGKWQSRTQNITGTSYITPKNSITPGKTYKVAIAARVNGKWDTENAIKNAVTITIHADTIRDADKDPLNPANIEYVKLINIPSGHSNQPDFIVSLVKSKMYDDEIFFAHAEGVKDTGGFLVTDDLKNQLNNLENDYQGHWLSTWASTEEAAAHAAKGETDQLVSKYFESGSSAYYGCWAYNMQAELDLLNYYTKIADQALQSYMVYTTLVMIYQSRMIAAQQEAMKVSQQEYLEMYKINEGTLSESTGSTVVWTGKDKYVPELANEIERNFPGRVQAVEKLVRNSEGLPVTDFDIEMDTVVIQVKSGTATGLTRQMVNTSTVTDKIVISYTPDISPTAAVLKSVQEKGFYTFTNVEELLEFLSTH